MNLGNQELNSSPQPSMLKGLHSCYEDRQSGTITDRTSGRNKGRFSNNKFVFMEESNEEASEKPDPQSYNLKDTKFIVRPF